MTESRAVSIVLAVGMLLAGCIALIAFGPLAVNVLLCVVVAALILERTAIFRRVDEVWEDTDKALVNSAAAVEAVEELRAFLVEFRAALEAEDDDQDNPTTQPIELPEPQGPPTEPVTEVAARQVRALMEEGVEMVERTYVVDGVQRTFRLRAVKEDA